MFVIDVKTFMFCLGLFCLLLSGMTFVFSKVFPKSIKGLFEWGVALLLLGTGLLLFLLRGLTDNPWLTHYFSNLFIVSSTAFFLFALINYHSKITLFKICCCVFVIFFLVFTIEFLVNFDNIIAARTLILLLPAIFFLITSSFLLFKNERQDISPISVLSSFAMFSIALVMAFRCFAILRQKASINIFDSSASYQLIFFTFIAVATIIASLGFIFTAIERLNFEVLNSKLQAEHSNRLHSLGEVVAGIAHEINNPMSIIRSSLYLLEKNLNEQTKTENSIGKLIQKSNFAIDRVTNIIKGLRTFSRQDENVQLELSSISTIIDDTLLLCHERVKSLDITLSVEPPPEQKIKCSATQISQVILNLIINAVDAVSDQSVIDKFINIKFSKVDSFFQVIVENSGPEISRSVRQKMFQPFFTTKSVGKGTGMGLSISLGIAQNHGGNLYYDDTKQITTFVLSLPC